MPVATFGGTNPTAGYFRQVMPSMPHTPLQVHPAALTPRDVAQPAGEDARMREYEAPLFPDGTVLPPDVCALLGFPYGTVSRGLNLTLSMLEQIKRQKMGLPPVPSVTPTQTHSTPTPSMYSQSTTPTQPSPLIEASASRNLMPTFDATTSGSVQELTSLQDAGTTNQNGSSPIARTQSNHPVAKLSQPDVDRDPYESEETVMLPCCRSCLPRRKAEEALQHGNICPCCQASGVEASQLIPLGKRDREEVESCVRLPCCRSRVPKDKIRAKLHDSDRCPCCHTTGIVFPMLRPVLSDQVQELPDLQVSVDWTDQVIMPCCHSHVCRAHAEAALLENGACPVCNAAGLDTSMLRALEISSSCARPHLDARRQGSFKRFGSNPNSSKPASPGAEHAAVPDVRLRHVEEAERKAQEERGPPPTDEEGWDKMSLGQIAQLLHEGAPRTSSEPGSAQPTSSGAGSEAGGAGGEEEAAAAAAAAAAKKKEAEEEELLRANSMGLFSGGGGVDETPARGVRFGQSQFSKSSGELEGGTGATGRKKWEVKTTPQGFIRNTTMFSDAPKLFSKSMNNLHAQQVVRRESRVEEVKPREEAKAEAAAEPEEEAAAAKAEEEGWNNMSLNFVSQLLNEEASKHKPEHDAAEREPESEEFVVPAMR